MKTKRCILTLLAVCLVMAVSAQSDMNKFVDQLLQKMTLEEKLGQLNLAPASDEIVTGGNVDTEVGARIASGQLGGVFNLKGVDKIKALQDIAVKKSRLGIPLIVGPCHVLGIWLPLRIWPVFLPERLQPTVSIGCIRLW